MKPEELGLNGGLPAPAGSSPSWAVGVGPGSVLGVWAGLPETPPDPRGRRAGGACREAWAWRLSRLLPQDWGSLDACLQATLSALYPPFTGSADALLGQVLAVVERAYSGDGLRYLLDFLLPARHILHCVQLHACVSDPPLSPRPPPGSGVGGGWASLSDLGSPLTSLGVICKGQYPGRLFAHAGWPLCLGEHVVVHLASLDWRLLEPGDFYLQLVPFLRRQPRLVLTCLAPGGHSAQQLPLPEASYSAIFTAHWLDALNASRVPGTWALRSCLLGAPGGRVLRVAWEQVLRPCFLDEPGVESPPRAVMTSLGPSGPAPSRPSPLPGSPGDSGRDTPENPKPPGISQCQAGCEEESGTQGPRPAPDTHSSESQREGSPDTMAPPAHATDWRYAVCSYDDALVEEGSIPTPEELTEAFSPPGPPQEALPRGEQLATPPTSQGGPPGATDLQHLLLRPPQPTLEDDQSSEEGTKLCGHESPRSSGPAQDKGQGCGPEQGGEGPLKAGPGSPAPSDPEAVQGKKESRDPEKDPGLESPGGENLLGVEEAEKPLSSGELEQCPASKGPFPALPVPVRATLAQDLSPKLLDSGLAALPGTRDSEGRVVLLVCTQNLAWLGPHCGIQELAGLFLYLHSIPRPEDQARGLTVLVDARHCLPSPNLFLGLSQMQKIVPGSVHQVLLLGKISGAPPPGLKLELLPSRQALLSFIPNSQLPLALGGCLSYNHNAWLDFRKRLEALKQSYLEACVLLCRAIKSVEAAPEPEGPGGAEQLLQDPQELMQQVLEYPLLAWLQREGGTALAELQREDPGGIQSPDHRLAVDEAGRLYAQVDGLLHQLVTLCNRRMRALELGKMLEAQAGTLVETQAWLQNVGWPGLKGPEEPSLDTLLQARDAFWKLDQAAQEHIHFGEEILAGWEVTELGQLGAPGARLISLQTQLSEFSRALARRRQQLMDAQHLSQLLDQALVQAQAGQKALAKLTEEERASPEMVLRHLERHQLSNPDLAPSHFQEMEALAAGLGFDLTIQQCRLLSTWCQDTQVALARKLEAARRAQQVLPALARGHRCPLGGGSSSSSDQASLASGRKTEERASSSNSSGSATSHVLRRAHTLEAGAKQSLWGSVCQLRLGESPALPSASAVPHGPSGSSMGAVGCQQAGPPIQRPLGSLKASPSSPLLEASTQNRLHLILGEMVATEREYVRALDYVVESYFPELERADVPQGLRGQRSRLFGNLEKLRDFHRHFFLRELESCSQHPLRVAHAFLRHREQFGMYALYSKNKPRSDALLASHGNAFFKDKQRCLGDHLDLASYLLKPIHRMSKYVLLLQELSRTCKEEPGLGWSRGPDLAALHAACDLVRFQLRHGNDLLAMDAICGCDVNLKEQGQLVRQDEFTVWSGRKKCQRHIFLFEELILFSKSRHGPRGIDSFIYKHSFKTADIGLTENFGESGLCFEIWFRRRKASDTFVLQALTTENKQAWTADIASLLWRQAARNKELRMAEMVSMGVGNKPFLDITPSEAAINDRAINYIMKGRGARTRASIAVSLFDHTDPYPGSPAPIPTGPSSCSLLGPLNLHLCGDPARLGLSWPLHPTAYLEEELDPETETGSQPSLTPESSEASSQCPSASSSGSDSGCVAGLTLASGCEDQPIPPLEDKAQCGQSQYISSV
ncbi:puratrophin-1 [Trichosurus vulpecula]|uniref:puratrophin-1 n=1 Tax=Trichosurus vulpecula TaxID=9337 RepID=UPI00186AC721|nr:puratrophin-1 [Trichosurus vulpecula]